MGNSATSSRRRVHDKWHYFDKLPPRLRAAISGSAFLWDSKWFYDRWNKGASVDDLIAQLIRWNLNNANAPIKERVGFKWKKVASATSQHGVGPLNHNCERKSK